MEGVQLKHKVALRRKGETFIVHFYGTFRSKAFEAFINQS